MKRLMIGVVAALVMGIVGCSSPATVSPAPTSSSPTPVAAPTTAPPVQPVSALAPGLTLPDGSVDTAATAESPDMELWEPTVSYEATVAHLAGHLPSGQDFDGLRWCQKTVSNFGAVTQWEWATNDDDLLVVAVMAHGGDNGPGVAIHRGPEEDARSGCDVP